MKASRILLVIAPPRMPASFVILGQMCDRRRGRRERVCGGERERKEARKGDVPRPSRRVGKPRSEGSRPQEKYVPASLSFYARDPRVPGGVSLTLRMTEKRPKCKAAAG